MAMQMFFDGYFARSKLNNLEANQKVLKEDLDILQIEVTPEKMQETITILRATTMRLRITHPILAHLHYITQLLEDA
jgi:hypothetical protein